MKEFHYDFMNREEGVHWWYRIRRKIVHDLIRNLYPGRDNLKILDAGCGTGGMLVELARYGNVYGVDESEQAVNYCLKKSIPRVLLSGVSSLPYESNMFDIVTILDVLEHINDDSSAIREIQRVLKPGGYCIIFVPAFSFLWSITDVVSKHFRRYNMSGLFGLLSGSRLRVIRKSYFNFFLFFPIAIIRMLVRLLKLPVKSENGFSHGIINSILYGIFYLESSLLKYINFPFGVSILVVCKKDNEK